MEEARNKYLVTPELVNEWKKNYLKEGHTVHSTTTYYNYIKRFVGHGIEVSQKTVDKFRATNSTSASSGALKNFFYYLIEKKEFPREIAFIFFGKNKSTKKFPNSLEPIEVQKIIDSMPSLKDKIFTKFLFELGLRISEGLKIVWADFNWATWLLNRKEYGNVRLKNTKRGKFRVLPVSPDLMELLYADNISINKTTQGIPIGNFVFNFGFELYMDQEGKSQEEWIFDYIIYAENRYRKILKDVGNAVLNKAVNPHRLRHTKAQFLLDQGMPIESLKVFLGHARISSTEIYAEASAKKLEDDLKKFDKKEENINLNNENKDNDYGQTNNTN